MRKRIAYGKIGRVVEIEPSKWGETGGDNEPPVLLLTLADRHPDVDWVVVGKNSGWKPPRPNIINMWEEWLPELKFKSTASAAERVARYDEVTMGVYDTLDGIVMWLGQHGTSNTPIPKVDNRNEVTSPQMSFVAYSSFILRGINRWRMNDPLTREEVWLLADVRNSIKARDLKWPRRHPILTQFNYTRAEWNERYGDPRTPEELGFTDVEVIDGMWRHTDQYIASGLELVGIPDPKPLDELPGWEERDRFGILINEARGYGMRPELTRLHAMQHYVKPLDPTWVHGTWTAPSLEKLGMDIAPVEYSKIFGLMEGTKSTFTTPSSGSGWATAKPWESFGQGIICFFHPAYDTQGHILPHNADGDLGHLAKWLRVTSPEDLARKVEAVHSSRDTYEWLAKTQYEYLKSELEAQRCVKLIDERIGL